jgi:8-oxo-dGTP diphosphatase
MTFNDLCKFLSENTESVACATIIFKDNKILLLKRGNTAPWMPNKWNLPGGTLDKGESAVDCAKREALEETGLILGNLKLVNTIPQSWGTFYLYSCIEYKGNIKLSWENTEYGWFSIQDAIKMDLVPPLKEEFKILLRKMPM